MKTHEIQVRPPRRHPLAALRTALGLALVPASTCHGLAGDAASTVPALVVDASALRRDERLPASLAPVVQQVFPSVVSILTTRTVRSRRPEWHPFPEDPWFQWFFRDSPEPTPGPEPTARRERGLGSGVILTKDGYILTNDHVVEGTDGVKVSWTGAQAPMEARVVGRDPQSDLAVLKVDASEMAAITLADSDQVEVGDGVLAVGNRFGVGPSVSHGIISAVHRGGLGTLEDFLQTDAPLHPGHSGGALVDVQGRLVGINTAIASRTGANLGVGFAIPANRARGVMETLVREGRGHRGFLGLAIQDLNPELAHEFGAPEARGALVAGLAPEGPAAKAGVERGDIVVGLEGQPVHGVRDLRLRLSRRKPGSTVELQVLRKGKAQVFRVPLQEGPATTQAPDAAVEVMRDVAVGDITPELRRDQAIPEGVRGAHVTQVSPDSVAYAAGLRAGDVLLEIDHREIPDAASAVQATRNVPNRRALLRIWSPRGERFLVVDEGRQDVPKEDSTEAPKDAPKETEDPTEDATEAPTP